MGVKAADFSGYATKAGLKCSDGRTIMPNAFEHQDKMTVPLVWQHDHNEPGNVLGHAILENREDGVYAHGYFNDTEQGKSAKTLVQHGDITFLSIYANQLVERAKQVFHGAIREVSLVLAGANPGAKIDFVAIRHADGDIEQLEDEAIIYTGLKLEHAEASDDSAESNDDSGDSNDDEGPTIQEVYDSMNDEQKEVTHYMIGAALEAAEDSAEHSETNEEENLNHQEGNEMTRNVFEDGKTKEDEKYVLTHSDIQEIKDNWKSGGSMKHAVESFAVAHGIENLDLLFPDAKAIGAPEFDKRRTEWVSGVINGTRKSPFSRIKTLLADLTHDEARAKGYIKGSLKKEEFFGLTKRTTAPTTVYKKQKLDRDDILDATELDVVAWMKAEMRMMLEEEVARAILIGDGRAVDDEDKIKDPIGATDGVGIRSILNDHELYAVTVNVNIDDASSSYNEVVDAILKSRKYYKGSGNPKFYTTEEHLTGMLLVRDTLGRRIYRTVDELANELRVSEIVPVEVMESETDLIGIIVNLSDYNVGTDKGGEVTLFDDFDIDYNQYKYLIETRFSGALVKIRSALLVKKTASGNVLVTPNELPFDPETNTIDWTAQTGVVYKKAVSPFTSFSTFSSDQVITEDTAVKAEPASGYYFPSSENDEWMYEYQA